MERMVKMMMIMLGLFAGHETKAQLWTTDNRVLSDPHAHHANQNGTYYYQHNPNNNMGTAPNNAMYKNQAEFYNKDNYSNTLFPTANGMHYTPGAQGYNYHGNNYINANTPGSYNQQDVNGRSAPVFNNPNNNIVDPNQPQQRR